MIWVLAVLGYGLVSPIGCSHVVLFMTLYQYHIRRTSFQYMGPDKTPWLATTAGDSIPVHYTPKNLLKNYISQFPVRPSSEEGVKIQEHYFSFILQWFIKSPLPVITVSLMVLIKFWGLVVIKSTRFKVSENFW